MMCEEILQSSFSIEKQWNTFNEQKSLCKLSNNVVSLITKLLFFSEITKTALFFKTINQLATTTMSKLHALLEFC